MNFFSRKPKKPTPEDVGDQLIMTVSATWKDKSILDLMDGMETLRFIFSSYIFTIIWYILSKGKDGGNEFTNLVIKHMIAKFPRHDHGAKVSDFIISAEEQLHIREYLEPSVKRKIPFDDPLDFQVYMAELMVTSFILRKVLFSDVFNEVEMMLKEHPEISISSPEHPQYLCCATWLINQVFYGIHKTNLDPQEFGRSSIFRMNSFKYYTHDLTSRISYVKKQMA